MSTKAKLISKNGKYCIVRGIFIKKYLTPDLTWVSAILWDPITGTNFFRDFSEYSYKTIAEAEKAWEEYKENENTKKSKKMIEKTMKIKQLK